MLCQQLFKIIFCCPLRNISVSRVSLKIISCCDVFVNNFFIFFLLSFEAAIRFAVSSIILSCWQVFVNSIFYIFFTFLLLLKSQIISCAFPVFLYHICHSYSIANIIIHTFPEVSYLSFSDFLHYILPVWSAHIYLHFVFTHKSKTFSAFHFRIPIYNIA